MYRNTIKKASKEDQAMATGTMHKKFGYVGCVVFELCEQTDTMIG